MATSSKVLNVSGVEGGAISFATSSNEAFFGSHDGTIYRASLLMTRQQVPILYPASAVVSVAASHLQPKSSSQTVTVQPADVAHGAGVHVLSINDSQTLLVALSGSCTLSVFSLDSSSNPSSLTNNGAPQPTSHSSTGSVVKQLAVVNLASAVATVETPDDADAEFDNKTSGLLSTNGHYVAQSTAHCWLNDYIFVVGCEDGGVILVNLSAAVARESQRQQKKQHQKEEEDGAEGESNKYLKKLLEHSKSDGSMVVCYPIHKEDSKIVQLNSHQNGYQLSISAWNRSGYLILDKNSNYAAVGRGGGGGGSSGSHSPRQDDGDSPVPGHDDSSTGNNTGNGSPFPITSTFYKVGQKDRAPGAFGSCFANKHANLLSARPARRLFQVLTTPDPGKEVLRTQLTIRLAEAQAELELMWNVSHIAWKSPEGVDLSSTPRSPLGLESPTVGGGPDPNAPPGTEIDHIVLVLFASKLLLLTNLNTQHWIISQDVSSFGQVVDLSLFRNYALLLTDKGEVVSCQIGPKQDPALFSPASMTNEIKIKHRLPVPVESHEAVKETSAALGLALVHPRKFLPSYESPAASQDGTPRSVVGQRSPGGLSPREGEVMSTTGQLPPSSSLLAASGAVQSSSSGNYSQPQWGSGSPVASRATMERDQGVDNSNLPPEMQRLAKNDPTLRLDQFDQQPPSQQPPDTARSQTSQASGGSSHKGTRRRRSHRGDDGASSTGGKTPSGSPDSLFVPNKSSSAKNSERRRSRREEEDGERRRKHKRSSRRPESSAVQIRPDELANEFKPPADFKGDDEVETKEQNNPTVSVADGGTGRAAPSLASLEVQKQLAMMQAETPDLPPLPSVTDVKKHPASSYDTGDSQEAKGEEAQHSHSSTAQEKEVEDEEFDARLTALAAGVSLADVEKGMTSNSPSPTNAEDNNKEPTPDKSVVMNGTTALSREVSMEKPPSPATNNTQQSEVGEQLVQQQAEVDTSAKFGEEPPQVDETAQAFFPTANPTNSTDLPEDQVSSVAAPPAPREDTPIELPEPPKHSDTLLAFEDKTTKFWNDHRLGTFNHPTQQTRLFEQLVQWLKECEAALDEEETRMAREDRGELKDVAPKFFGLEMCGKVISLLHACCESLQMRNPTSRPALEVGTQLVNLFPRIVTGESERHDEYSAVCRLLAGNPKYLPLLSDYISFCARYSAAQDLKMRLRDVTTDGYCFPNLHNQEECRQWRPHKSRSLGDLEKLITEANSRVYDRILFGGDHLPLVMYYFPYIFASSPFTSNRIVLELFPNLSTWYLEWALSEEVHKNSVEVLRRCGATHLMELSAEDLSDFLAQYITQLIETSGASSILRTNDSATHPRFVHCLEVMLRRRFEFMNSASRTTVTRKKVQMLENRCRKLLTDSNQMANVAATFPELMDMFDKYEFSQGIVEMRLTDEYVKKKIRLKEIHSLFPLFQLGDWAIGEGHWVNLLQGAHQEDCLMDAMMMHLTLHNNDPAKTHSVLQTSFSSMLEEGASSSGAKGAAYRKSRASVLPGDKMDTGKAIALQESQITIDSQLQECLKKLAILML